VGEYYEVTTTETTKHYSVGGQRVAVREHGTLTYLLGDHLGGTSAVINSTGQKVAENWYLPFGDTRYSSGTLPTGYTYTGQFDNTADFGWMYYKARWYDPTLGRFGQPDSVVPGAGDLRAWDRFSYVKNNPVEYSDPTGHDPNSWFSPWNAYVTGWNNASVALSIVTNSNTTVTQRLLPAAYLTAWAGAHVMLATGIALLGCSAITTCAETIGSGSEVITTLSDEIKEPETLYNGNKFHYGEGGGPDQLEDMYPNTEIRFKGRGEKGPDVEYFNGDHPSTYPDSTWNSENNYGDFKPNTSSSESRFNYEIQNGKLPPNTQPLPYDPYERKLLRNHKFDW
jgi:RHS repeat-associated protein